MPYYPPKTSTQAKHGAKSAAKPAPKAAWRDPYQESIPLGILGGLGGAVLGAILWAFVTAKTGFQIGYVAIAVGAVVGFGIRFAGRAESELFQFIGAACGVVGWLLGTILSDIAMAAKANDERFFEMLGNAGIGYIFHLVPLLFSPMDVVFFGITVYEAWKFSVRRH